MERSLFFIKPEACQYDMLILECIRQKLRVHSMEPKLMSMLVVRSLYGHLEERILEKLERQMVAKPCLIGIVQGKNAIADLVSVSGEKTEPYLCTPKTVRFMFGNHTPGFEHQNAIHRPKTREEAHMNLRLFGYKVEVE